MLAGGPAREAATDKLRDSLQQPSEGTRGLQSLGRIPASPMRQEKLPKEQDVINITHSFDAFLTLPAYAYTLNSN